MSNAKAGETSIRNWYISCDDAWYKSPEPTHAAGAEPNVFELCLARRRKTKSIFLRFRVP